MSRSFYKVYARARQKDAMAEISPTYWNFNGLRFVAGAIVDRVLISDELATTFDFGRLLRNRAQVLHKNRYRLGIAFCLRIKRGKSAASGFLFRNSVTTRRRT
jgi:hypothetical protein